MGSLDAYPKLYFVDTGLLCHLLGIDSGERFFRAAERGSVFENMVVMDMVKRASLADVRTSLFFYRTQSGLELDLLVEQRGKLSAYEIKLSKSINSRMATPLKRFQNDYPESNVSLLCLREEPLALAEGIYAKHWTSIQ